MLMKLVEYFTERESAAELSIVTPATLAEAYQY